MRHLVLSQKRPIFWLYFALKWYIFCPFFNMSFNCIFGHIFISFLIVSGPVRAKNASVFMWGALFAIFCVYLLCCVSIFCASLLGGDADLRVPSGCDNLIPNNHLTLSHTGLLVTRAACCFQIAYRTKCQTCGLPAGRPAGRPHLLPPAGPRFCHGFCGRQKGTFFGLFSL